MKPFLKSLVSDFRFWLFIFFVIRIVGITNAPLEVGHSWRQCLTNMIARNILEISPNMLYPRIDMAGEATGIIGSEFPFLNYIIYLVSLLFGYQHWYGRLINLMVTSLGVYFFYKSIHLLFSKKLAFNAAIILLSSIWFGFARKIMPDTFSISLIFIGMYFAIQFLKSGRPSLLLLVFLMLSLALLSKIPALSYFPLIVVPWFIKDLDIKRKYLLTLTVVLASIPGFVWYFYWVPYLLQTYHYQLYFPKGLMEGLREIIPLWPLAAEKFYFSALLSYTALAAFAGGLVYMVKDRQHLMLMSALLFSGVFGAFILKTGAVFPMHSYYIIPFTPLMALVAGYGLSKINLKLQAIVLVLIAAEGIANQQHDFFIKPSETYKTELEALANQVSTKNQRIMINGNNNPQLMYFAHRKGWNCFDHELADTSYLFQAKRKGCAVVIVNKHENNFRPPLQLVIENEHFAVFKF